MAVGVSTARGHEMSLDLIIGEIEQEIENGILHKSSTAVPNVRSTRQRSSQRPVPAADPF
jgi:hypothetical protein